MVRLVLVSVAMAAGLWSGEAGRVQAATKNNSTPSPKLWQPPRHLADCDLFTGPWPSARRPDVEPTLAFVRAKRQGVNPGFVARDASGRMWHVKQAPHSDRGDEGPVEVAISRVLSAVGYYQPPIFFAPSLRVADASGATRVEAGGRVRLHERSMRYAGHWSWQKNPFVSTRPYNGLLVILMMFNSWDLKDVNNALYDVDRDDGVERWYVVQDLGGALGESGTLRPKRNDIDAFERQPFITGVKGGFVEFAYHGKEQHLIHRSLTVDDVRWAGDLLAGLNDRQWRDAFAAGGYEPALAGRFIRKIRTNVAEAQHVDERIRP